MHTEADRHLMTSATSILLVLNQPWEQPQTNVSLGQGWRGPYWDSILSVTLESSQQSWELGKRERPGSHFGFKCYPPSFVKAPERTKQAFNSLYCKRTFRSFVVKELLDHFRSVSLPIIYGNKNWQWLTCFHPNGKSNFLSFCTCQVE